MAPFPARSVDSTMVTEDDDPTITVGGLANDNQEPELVNQSPIAPLAMKPVLTIDKVVAGQAVSFEALPPFLPSANGFAVDDLKQPSWLDVAVIKLGDAGRGGDVVDVDVIRPGDAERHVEVVEDATRALNTEVVAEEVREEHVASVPASVPLVQESLRAANTQPNSPPSSLHNVQEKVDTTMPDGDKVTKQAGQLEEGELLTANGLQLSFVPQANTVDLDRQDLTYFDFGTVADKLLNDDWFIERVTRRVIATQDVPHRQLEPVAGAGARSVLVVNYTQSLIRYCEVAGLPPPNFTMESRGAESEKRYRATVIVGKPKLTFTRPIARGHFGNKREVREDAALAAWEHLLHSGAIIGTGFFVDPQHQQRNAGPGTGQGRLTNQPHGQSGNSIPRSNQPAAGGIVGSGFKGRGQSKGALYRPAISKAHLEATRPQANTHSPSLFRFEEPGSRGSGTPKSPPINPARLHMLRHADPVNEPDPHPTFDAALGPKNSGANIAPLGRNRLGFSDTSSTTGPQATIASADPPRKILGAPSGAVPAPPAFEAHQPYKPPQKRDRDQLEGTALAARQLSHIGRLLEPTATSKAAPKSMTELVAFLSGKFAPLVRVEAICQYISIQSPQYFEFARDGDRVRWGARISPTYLNTQILTLGPTLSTWNEVLGKTTCARQFVEPYLMAGIKLHGFGRGENTQIELRDEPGSKRQKVEDDGLSSRKYEAIRDEVEEFVQGIKTQVVKTERVA